MRGDLEVELDVGQTEIVPGYLADALEAVFERAAVHRQRLGRGVVAAAAVEVLAQRQYQRGAVLGVVVDQRAEPLGHEALHGRRVARRRQDLVDAEAVEQRNPLGTARRLLYPQRQLRFLTGLGEPV